MCSGVQGKKKLFLSTATCMWLLKMVIPSSLSNTASRRNIRAPQTAAKKPRQ